MYQQQQQQPQPPPPPQPNAYGDNPQQNAPYPGQQNAPYPGQQNAPYPGQQNAPYPGQQNAPYPGQQPAPYGQPQQVLEGIVNQAPYAGQQQIVDGIVNQAPYAGQPQQIIDGIVQQAPYAIPRDFLGSIIAKAVENGANGQSDAYKYILGNYLFSRVDVIRGHQRAPSGSREFKELTKRDAQVQLQHELDRLLNTAPEAHRALAQGQLDGFARLFDRFMRDEGPSLLWENIERLPENAVRDYYTLPQPSSDLVHCMLDKLVVVKLNGGLGTSMGCHGPKSVIPVRSDLTFLDLTVQQIEHLNKTYKANVPLVLMNSFNTDEDTQKIIRKYKGLQVEIYTFNQSCYPRINRDSLLPVPKTCDVMDNMEAWYPPGHGDFYYSFQESGLLRRFLEEGRQYCFVSNIDNLGATVDLNILNLLMDPSSGDPAPEFVMEVTDKTRADVKGGTLIQYEGKLRLLEIAQVPKEHVDDFKSVKTFKFFNTNNLWAKLDAIKRVLDDNTLNMEVIVNNKSLENGVNIIQLETAVGAAMKCFDGGLGINVPRSRFLPVKKTSDLLLVMSNLYSLQSGSLVMSPERMFPTTPFVKLGDNHFGKVKEFLARFANIPDLMELDHLTVSGDVTFGRSVSLKGTVIVIANHGDRIDIPSGSVLENKIVSGNMRILDH